MFSKQGIRAGLCVTGAGVLTAVAIALIAVALGGPHAEPMQTTREILGAAALLGLCLLFFGWIIGA